MSLLTDLHESLFNNTIIMCFHINLINKLNDTLKIHISIIRADKSGQCIAQTDTKPGLGFVGQMRNCAPIVAIVVLAVAISTNPDDVSFRNFVAKARAQNTVKVCIMHAVQHLAGKPGSSKGKIKNIRI